MFSVTAQACGRAAEAPSTEYVMDVAAMGDPCTSVSKHGSNPSFTGIGDKDEGGMVAAIASLWVLAHSHGSYGLAKPEGSDRERPLVWQNSARRTVF